MGYMSLTKAEKIGDQMMDELYRNSVPKITWKQFVKKYSNTKIDGYKKTDRFWCSALVAYVFSLLGFLDKNIPWTIISPSDFSCVSSRLQFIDCSLDKDKLLV